MIRAELVLIRHFLGLFNLLFVKTASHEHAVELPPILYVVLYLCDRDLGLVTRILSSFTKHIHDSLDNSPAILVVLDP